MPFALVLIIALWIIRTVIRSLQFPMNCPSDFNSTPLSNSQIIERNFDSHFESRVHILCPLSLWIVFGVPTIAPLVSLLFQGEQPYELDRRHFRRDWCPHC